MLSTSVRKLVLRIGEPRSFGHLPPGRETVKQIAEELGDAVTKLGDLPR